MSRVNLPITPRDALWSNDSGNIEKVVSMPSMSLSKASSATEAIQDGSRLTRGGSSQGSSSNSSSTILPMEDPLIGQSNLQGSFFIGDRN
jgi:hypothetical protein